MKRGPFEFTKIYGAGGASDPYLTRVRIGRLRLHIFHRGDNDPDPHTHPWDFWTFPLVAYVEDILVPLNSYVASRVKSLKIGQEIRDPSRRLIGKLVAVDKHDFTVRQHVRAFTWHFRPADYAHRVVGPFDRIGWNGAGEIEYRLRHRGGKPLRIWTIVWTGKVAEKWGFLKRCADATRQFVPWREYDRRAPCSPASRRSPTAGSIVDIRSRGRKWP